jgi:hypothetical protein
MSDQRSITTRSRQELRAIARGEVTGESRGAAMSLLRDLADDQILDILGGVLRDQSDNSRFRELAATNIGRLGTPAALDVLMDSVEVSDGRAQRKVLRYLGRLGDTSAIPVVESARGRTQGLAAQEARFAAQLLAHRWRTGDSGFSPLVGVESPRRRPGMQDAMVRRVGEEDATQVRRALETEPLGVSLQESGGLVLDMSPAGRWTVLLDRTFAQTPGQVFDAPSVVGIVAAEQGYFDDALHEHAEELIILSSPSPTSQAAHVHLHASDGELIFYGDAQPQPGGRGGIEVSIARAPEAAALSIYMRARFSISETVVEEAAWMSAVGRKRVGVASR